jgi:hypothetical protein
MAIVYGNHIPKHQWHQSAFMTWQYLIPNPLHYMDDDLTLRYDSDLEAWRIYINDNYNGAHAPELGEAQDLAIMLFKLHYTNN